MRVTAPRLAAPPVIDGRWDKAPWSLAPAERLRRHMGGKPTHFPVVDFKVAYDAAAIYVIFGVEDRYVRAVAADHQDAVCKDSCVEFFFIPSAERTDGYFNLEMNCGGTMLFHHQLTPRTDSVSVGAADCDRVVTATSMPRIVEPEIDDDVVWTAEYAVPFDLLEAYAPVERPAPGVVWPANFYKCADGCSHPHWLTWAEVKHPKPDFHRPADFGELAFA